MALSSAAAKPRVEVGVAEPSPGTEAAQAFSIPSEAAAAGATSAAAAPGESASAPAAAAAPRTRKEKPKKEMATRDGGKDSQGKTALGEHVVRSFAKMGLPLSLYADGRGVGKHRQHVNPLKRTLLAPVESPVWADVFEDPSRPLVVDIGCGPGRFLLALARSHGCGTVPEGAQAGAEVEASNEAGAEAEASNEAGIEAGACPVPEDSNLLGFEIRAPVVKRAKQWVEYLSMEGKVSFLLLNGTVNTRPLLAGYPGRIDTVCVQYPDPHFKKKLRKRRIVQLALVRDLAAMLPAGSKIFLQSDVLEVAEDMRLSFALATPGAFEPHPIHADPAARLDERARATDGEPVAREGGEGGAPDEAEEGVRAERGVEEGDEAEEGGDGDDEADGEERGEAEEGGEAATPLPASFLNAGWLRNNPLGVPTEREVYTLKGGRPVYRCLLVRTAQS